MADHILLDSDLPSAELIRNQPQIVEVHPWQAGACVYLLLFLWSTSLWISFPDERCYVDAQLPPAVPSSAQEDDSPLLNMGTSVIDTVKGVVGDENWSKVFGSPTNSTEAAAPPTIPAATTTGSNGELEKKSAGTEVAGVNESLGVTTKRSPTSSTPGPLKLRNICLVHLYPESKKAEGMFAWIDTALQEYDLRDILIFFVVSTWSGFTSMMQLQRGVVNPLCGILSTLLFTLASAMATVMSLGNYLPWKVYEPELLQAHVIPWLFVYIMSAFLWLNFVMPLTMVLGCLGLCGIVAICPCLMPLYLRIFREHIMNGGLAANLRPQRSVEEILARVTFFRLETEDEVASLPTENCTICLQDWVIGEEIAETPCKHIFHRDCVEKWASFSGDTCPVCRSSFSPEIPDGEVPLINPWGPSGSVEARDVQLRNVV